MSELKFKLTDETKTVFGVKLFRIEATVDIPARGVKKGDKGGFVESTHISNGDARVYGNAWVYGDAWVYGNARVSGNARVYGNARVSGNARVYGNARVSGNARVYGNAQVSGDAWVYGNARVSARASFTLGKFIGGDDSDEPTFTEITDQTGTDYWKHQYVIGDYKIESIVDVPQEGKTGESELETIVLNGKTYRLVED